MLNNQAIGIIIQARMDSSRYYGKVMAPIQGIPMLQHLVSRVSRSKRINGITIATTTGSRDEVIEQLGRQMGVNVFRGSEEDVIGRITAAATSSGYDIVVKLTGDNPLYDSELIDAMVEFYLNNGYDLVANAAMTHIDQWQEQRTFPLGLGVQIFRTLLLKEIEQEYHDPSSREHVTLPILRNPHIYKLGAFHASGKFEILNRPHYRLTVDTNEDFTLMSEIFKTLYPRDPNFSISSVIELLDSRPDLVKLNSNVKQKKPVDSSINEKG